MYPLTQRDIYDLCATDNAGDDAGTGGEGGSEAAGGERGDRGDVGPDLASMPCSPPSKGSSSSSGGGAGKVDTNGNLPAFSTPPHPPKLQRISSGDSFVVNRNNSSVVESWVWGGNTPQGDKSNPDMSTHGSTSAGVDASGSSNDTSVSHMLIDFTPADFITLLFTDLGVLTPAAVSDELIRLYQ
jgi:hypothetical protein